MKRLLLILTLVFSDAYAMQQPPNIQTEKEDVALNVFCMGLSAIDSKNNDTFVQQILVWAVEENYEKVIRGVLRLVKDSHEYRPVSSLFTPMVKSCLMQEAFIKAASLGRIRHMNLFLQEGVSINPGILMGSGIALGLGKEDSNALMKASKNGHLPAVQLLLAHNADTEKNDCDGHSALSYAIQGNHPEVTKALLEGKASANGWAPAGKNAIGFAVTQPILIWAIGQKDRHEHVKLLLEHGANIEVDSNGTTPLIKAALEDNTQCIEYLLERCADLDHVAATGYTALMCACERGYYTAVKQILGGTPDPQLKNIFALIRNEQGNYLNLLPPEIKNEVCHAKALKPNLRNTLKLSLTHHDKAQDDENKNHYARIIELLKHSSSC